jgi:hypothetical protein
MSQRLETSAEILKLARLVEQDPDQLGFLDSVSPAELRALREGVTNTIFDAGAQSLKRVAAGAKLLPSPLVAAIALKSFGALLCARAAGAVDPGKAIDVAKRLPADFLVDVTIQLDPRRVAKIIGQVPQELVVPVAAELGRREEHVTMGRFLAYVPDSAVVAAMTALSDEALLRTAFVLEHKDRLDHALGLLPPERLPGIFANASQLGLWPEALDLLEHLSQARRGPIADVVAEQPVEVIEDLVSAVSAARIWENLLPVVGVMSDAHRLRLAAVPAFHEPTVLGEIIEAAAVASQWADLLPLIDALPDEVRSLAADRVAALDEKAVAELVAAVSSNELWPRLLPVVRSMSEGSRTAMAAMAPFHQDEVLREIVVAAATRGLWVDLVPLLRVLPDPVFAKIPDLVVALPLDLLTALITEALEALEILEPFIDILNRMDAASLDHIVGLIDSDLATLGEILIAAVIERPDVRRVLGQLPPDVLDAIDRAADRLGLRADLDKARA